MKAEYNPSRLLPRRSSVTGGSWPANLCPANHNVFVAHPSSLWNLYGTKIHIRTTKTLQKTFNGSNTGHYRNYGPKSFDYAKFQIIKNTQKPRPKRSTRKMVKVPKRISKIDRSTTQKIGQTGLLRK